MCFQPRQTPFQALRFISVRRCLSGEAHRFPVLEFCGIAFSSPKEPTIPDESSVTSSKGQ